MSNEGEVMDWSILKSLKYTFFRAKRCEAKSKRYNSNKLNKGIERIQKSPLFARASEIEYGPNPLARRSLKTIMLSFIIDIWTSLKALVRLKLSGQTDSQTEASNLIDVIDV